MCGYHEWKGRGLTAGMMTRTERVWLQMKMLYAFFRQKGVEKM